MKKLIGGKVRDTKTMDRVVKRSGDPNDCYSTFTVLLHDPRDNRFFRFHGNHWGGLGPDTLEEVEDPAAFIEEEGFELSDEDVAKIESLGLAK